MGLFFSSYMIGIGQPQYLCLDIPQSFNLKLTFFSPSLLSSKNLIAFKTDSSGTFRSFKNEELNIYPLPVYASSSILKVLSSRFGLTTAFIFKLYFFAKSKSL